MDLKQYKSMLQQCSMLPRGVQGIAKDVPTELQIEFKGIRWYPYQCVLYYNSDGVAMYQAVLHSLMSNSVVTVELGLIDGENREKRRRQKE